MAEPRVIRLSNIDRNIAMTGSITGIIQPQGLDEDSSTSGPPSSFSVPLTQRPLIRLVTLSERSLTKPSDTKEILVEVEGNPFSEALSVEQARALIEEFEAACRYIESTMK